MSTVINYFVSFSHRSDSTEAKCGAPQTTSNETCEEMKQGGGGGGESGEAYEMMDVTPTVTTPTKFGSKSATDVDETPSASSQPLPTVPSPSFETNKNEEDGV